MKSVTKIDPAAGGVEARAAPATRVLLLNNYEMDSVWTEWRAGRCPGHHLWGASQLSRFGLNVSILPFERFGPWNRHWRVQKTLGLDSLGMVALDQQLRALFHARSDVIYAACQDHSFLLARLRRLGLLRQRLVTTVHHPVDAGSEEERLLAGNDLVLCLSRTVRDRLAARRVLPPEKLVTVEWAPELDFYGPFVPWAPAADGSPPLVISAGKSNRDYDTLIDGARGLPCRLDIYCSANSVPRVAGAPAQVRLLVGERGSNAVGYVELRAAYAQAFAVAVPMPRVDRLAGLTSLLDAMALGRPLLMTRNDYIDIDIEREGFGFWVDAGDAAGWRQALQRLLSNPALALAMGQRARQLALRRYNLDAFSASLAGALAAMGPKRAKRRAGL